MPITETHRALGAWSLQLSADTPREILNSLEYLGHITVHVGRVDPRLAGDGLLSSSRYTGVLRGLASADDGHTLTGAGMAMWLGDEDKKGDVYETAISFTSQTFTQTIRGLLPASGAVTEGTFHPITGTYTGLHRYQDPRTAIDYVCDTMGGEWRVNGNATLDVGAEEDLFVVNPQAAVVRRDAGQDMRLRAFAGSAGVTVDVEDFSTRVVLLAESEGGTVTTGSADIAPGLNVFKDLHGNPVVLTRLSSESETSSTNADIRAQLLLNRFTGTRDALRLSTTDYDIKGTAAPGDYVWVHDPDIGLTDAANEVIPVRGPPPDRHAVLKGASTVYEDAEGNEKMVALDEEGIARILRPRLERVQEALMSTTTTPNLGLIMPTAGTGEPISISQVNANWARIDLLARAITCTSTTRPSSPFAGQLIYEADTHLIQLRNTANSGWQLVASAGIPAVTSTGSIAAPYTDEVVLVSDTSGGALRKYSGSTWSLWDANTIHRYKAANESVTNSVTPQNDDTFVFAGLPVGSAWELESFIAYDGAAWPSGGFRPAFSCTGTMSMYFSTFGAPFGAITSYDAAVQGIGASARVLATDTSTTIMACRLSGSLVVSVSGTLQFQWAQGISNATATRVLGSSWMKLTRIA